VPCATVAARSNEAAAKVKATAPARHAAAVSPAGGSTGLWRHLALNIQPKLRVSAPSEGPEDRGEEEQEEEREEPAVQAKLEVNEPGDAWEREADGVSAAVMRKADPASSGGLCPKCEEERRLHGLPPGLQRRCAECEAKLQQGQEEEEEEEKKAAVVQRQPSASGTAPFSGSAVPLPDAGSPLSGAVRRRIEPVLGMDLGGVRIHASSAARESARSLKAKAFTHRDHIWLGPGQSADDVELMAHEVTHVAQQTAGPGGPKPIQRAPADYRHPEDGGSVLSRMRARLRDEVGDDAAVAVAEPTLAASGAAPAGGSPAAGEGEGAPAPGTAARPRTAAMPDPEARRAAQQIDRGELESRKGELASEARPDVDRPARAAPQIDAAAAATQDAAEKPAEPIAEAKGAAAEGGDAKGKPEGKGAAEGAAATAANLADQAFAMADSQPMPTAEAQVVPPQPAAPVDAGGQPLPADPATDAAVVDLADRAQALRDGGLQMRAQAAEGRTNAGILRGNLELVRTGVGQAQESITTATGQVTARRGIAGQAREALGVSEQKAATVAAEAPGFQSKADEGKENSGPMASESSQLAAENRANTPDDPEAAANAQEQGGKIAEVGSGAATMDGAVTQTRSKAEGLAEEAAHARETNTATRGRLAQVDATLGRTEERLVQMSSQTEQASSRAEAHAGAPAELMAQADALDQRGVALIQASYELELRAHTAQTTYEQGMRSVPAQKVLPEEKGQGEEGVVQRQPEDGRPPVPTPEAPAPKPAAPADVRPEAAAAPAPEAAPEESPASTEAPAPEAAPTPTGDRYEDRRQVDLAGGLPSWLTGADPVDERQRQEASQREQQRRAEEVALINQWSGGRFEDLSAADRVGIALRLTGHSAWGSIGRIQWPGWAGAGRFALKALDPRSTLTGVVSGLSMMLSGGANLVSAEQWRRDPLGNLLKSAADIATGLTVVLGSITALAGLIIAVMTAITILSLGTAAPITGPIIAFCATVMTTVGGWTIAVGQVALVLQALVLIKNLIDAATAKTAEDLQAKSDQIRTDVGQMANVAMQVVGARAAQMGGRQLSGAIREAGGGVRFAARAPGQFFGGVRAGAGRLREMGLRGSVGRAGGRAVSRVRQGISRGLQAARALPGRVLGGLRAAPGRLLSGLRAAPGTLRSLPGRIAGGVRGLPGRVREGWGRFRQGMSRDFLVGEDIHSFGDAVRAAESEGVRFPGLRRPRPGEPPPTPRQQELLSGSAPKRGSQLSRAEQEAETDLANRSPRQPSALAGYEEEIRLPNGHIWRRRKGSRTWCRFSEDPDLCSIFGEGVVEATSVHIPRATSRIREQPGMATGGQRLPEITGAWLQGTQGRRISMFPGQIAQRMRDMQFRNWQDFTNTFWRMVAEDSTLSAGFSKANLARMRRGFAPFVVKAEATGGGVNAVYQLNHIYGLEHGGPVFDLDNLEIVTPKLHAELDQ
jgi:hypothetical protein